MMAYPGSIPSILILLKLLGLFYQKTLPLSNSPAGTACVRTMIRRIIEKPAEPRTWCLTASQPLFLHRRAPRPPPQNADRHRGRGGSLSSSPYFFVEEHHVRRLSVPTVPGDVVPHCPLALVPSSRSTTSAGTNPRRRHPAVLYMRLDFSKSRFFSINVY